MKSVRFSNLFTGTANLIGGVVFPEGAQMKTATPLETELRVFEAHREKWFREHPGKFVVIQDETVIPGFFDEYAVGFRTGLAKFGTGRSFLVKQIWRTEPVYFIGYEGAMESV